MKNPSTNRGAKKVRGRKALFIDSFTNGLDELTRRQQRDRQTVLRHLDIAKRFSVFEATANKVIAETMDSLVRDSLIAVDNSPGYPWSNVTLTKAGHDIAYPPFRHDPRSA